MSGERYSQLSYLEKTNPIPYLRELLDTIDRYNSPGINLFVWIRQKWMDRVTFPILYKKIDRLLKYSVKEMYYHPDHMIYILNTYISYMIDYCRVFNLTTTELLDFIFDPGVISLTISHSEPDQNGEYSITRYNIVVRSTIPLNLLDSSFDKYTVTSIEVDMEGSTFTLRQVCYDARSEDESAMAKVLFDKTFELDRDGRLRSPNYTISRELFEEDLEHYRLMIAQLMIFMGGLLHSTLQTVSLEPNQP